MKKSFFLFLIILIILGSDGCVKNSYIENQKDIHSYEKNNQLDYKVNFEEYSIKNENNKLFKIKYAKISGLADKKMENKINQTLKSSLIEWINKDCEWMSEIRINVTYKNSDYISLCYTKEWESPRGKGYINTYTRIGITINMHTGERVYLDNLIKDTKNLKRKLENYKYETEFSPPISSDEAVKIIQEASISEKDYLIESFKTDPFVYDEIKDEIASKTSFYLMDKNLVIMRDEYKLNDIYIDFKR